jgi:hypothetical protein
MLVMPERPWRIISSATHSTVWDGGDLIFDFNLQAFGVEPNECFELAAEKELPPGKYLRVYFAQHWSLDQSLADLAAQSPEMVGQQDICCTQQGRIEPDVLEPVFDNAARSSTSL